MNDLSYPIGKFEMKDSYTREETEKNIAAIDILPDTLGAALAGLKEEQIETRYREGGWTIRQVIHHLADSHMNAYIRTKRMLTEDNPVVSGYDQDAWANTADTLETDVEVSVSLLTMLHHRWVMLLRSLDPKTLKRTYRHAEYDKNFTVEQVIALYAWHGKHHVAHITGLRFVKSW